MNIRKIGCFVYTHAEAFTMAWLVFNCLLFVAGILLYAEGYLPVRSIRLLVYMIFTALSWIGGGMTFVTVIAGGP